MQAHVCGPDDVEAATHSRLRVWCGVVGRRARQVTKLTQVSDTRYKCTLSDGGDVAEAVLSNTVSQYVNDESLAELGLLKVDKFTVMEHNGDKK